MSDQKIEINIYNDTKERFDSFKASIEFPFLIEFGATEEDSKDALIFKLRKVVEELQILIQKKH